MIKSLSWHLMASFPHLLGMTQLVQCHTYSVDLDLLLFRLEYLDFDLPQFECLPFPLPLVSRIGLNIGISIANKFYINSQLKQPHFFCLKITFDHWFLVYNICLAVEKLNKEKYLKFCILFGAFFFQWYKLSLLLRYCRIDSHSL